MELVKNILIFLIGLVAFGTAIITFRTKILEYKSQRNKSAVPNAVPSPTVRISPIGQTNSRWARMTVFQRAQIIANFVAYMVTGLFLLFFALRPESHPATSKDVALVGVLVVTIITASRMPEP